MVVTITDLSSLSFPRAKLCYWCLHSISLLGGNIPPDLAGDVIDFLSRCQAPTGGFGGRPLLMFSFIIPHTQLGTFCRLCRRAWPATTPSTHLRLCDGPVLHRNRGSIQCHRQVMCFEGTLITSDLMTSEL